MKKGEALLMSTELQFPIHILVLTKLMFLNFRYPSHLVCLLKVIFSIVFVSSIYICSFQKPGNLQILTITRRVSLGTLHMSMSDVSFLILRFFHDISNLNSNSTLNLTVDWSKLFKKTTVSLKFIYVGERTKHLLRFQPRLDFKIEECPFWAHKQCSSRIDQHLVAQRKIFVQRWQLVRLRVGFYMYINKLATNWTGCLLPGLHKISFENSTKLLTDHIWD